MENLMTRSVMALLGCVFAVGSVTLNAQVTVLSGGAIEPGLRAAAAAFEKESGHEVTITFNTTPQMRERVAAGHVFDVVIAPPATVAEFAKVRKVEGDGVNVGRVGSGVAVRPGAPVPTIATADDVRKAVLEADSIVFNTASSGIYFENLLKKWGIYEQVEGKAARYTTGAEVMEHVLAGEGKEVGFGPMTEILLEREHGLVLVGPLPAEIQNYTSYMAVPMAAAPNSATARALIAFLGSPAGRRLFVAAGIE
jgi:molybdate transport system substrate-binding protein